MKQLEEDVLKESMSSQSCEEAVALRVSQHGTLLPSFGIDKNITSNNVNWS